MRHNEKLKSKVRELRSKGKTYSEIMTDLGISIPKSTLSNWSSNVDLPSWYQDKMNKLNIRNLNRAQKMAWASNKAKRERLINGLLTKNEHILKKLNDKDILKMLLSVLYLGEGSRWKTHRGLMLGSSDPNIIRLYMRLLYLCYSIGSDKLRGRVSYRADQNIHSLQKYWSQVTSIPIGNFYKTKPDPRTVGKVTLRRDYRGVCVLYCKGTDIQLELEEIPKLILKGI